MKLRSGDIYRQSDGRLVVIVELNDGTWHRWLASWKADERWGDLGNQASTTFYLESSGAAYVGSCTESVMEFAKSIGAET